MRSGRRFLSAATLRPACEKLPPRYEVKMPWTQLHELLRSLDSSYSQRDKRRVFRSLQYAASGQGGFIPFWNGFLGWHPTWKQRVPLMCVLSVAVLSTQFPGENRCWVLGPCCLPQNDHVPFAFWCSYLLVSGRAGTRNRCFGRSEHTHPRNLLSQRSGGKLLKWKLLL